MTSFVISTASETAQSLVSGETGVVTTSGSIVSLVGLSAIDGAGSYRLTIDGMVLGATYGINGASGSAGRISIGSGGYVSGGSAAINSSSSTSFDANNAGTLQGGTYGILSTTTNPATGHDFSLTNTGTISGGYGVYAAIIEGDATINNSGTILGRNNAIFVVSSGSDSRTSIDNSGILQASGATANAIYIDSGSSSIVNSGTINGSITLGGAASRLTNSGTINGNIYGSALADIYTFSGGTVSGTIFGDSGDDIYNVDTAGLRLVETSENGFDAV